MMGADEAGTHAAFKAHRSAVYPVILNHGGRLVKNTGDGFLLEFPSVVGAIESAVGMQALMAERNSQLPADRVMQFRLGVHMGDVMADEDEVFGDGVNIAVRLEAIAAPGGVAASAKAYNEASKHLSTPFADAGVHRFKNITEPVNVWTWEPARSESPGRESRNAESLPGQHRTAIVGVLPFANLSDSADEYFSDGLTEDLIHALSLQSFYRVLSRNSTFAFKGKSLSTRLIAREIDATYLIQGSVRRAGTKIRVTAELIAPENGEQLWAGRYDRDIGDLFAMQDEITTNSVRGIVSGNLSRRSFRTGAIDIDRPDRVGPVPEGTFPLLQTDQGGLRSLDRFVQGGHRARPGAVDCTRLSRHHPDAGRALLDGSGAPANCGARRSVSPKAVSGSIPAPRSHFQSCPI